MQVCASCGEENADRARFCQACGASLEASAEPVGEVRKVVSIVFADVTGSTALGEHLDPEALRHVMGRYFDEMERVIGTHGGTVEKFIGDAVMAVFGIPRLHEDDPLRAVRAARDMRSALDALNEELERDHGVGIRIRIGVNTGEVVAGDPSTGQRLVTGDAVNVAARLEQAAAPGEILLGATTHGLVKDAVEVDPVEPLEVKGKSERVPAFQLVEVRADVAGHARHLDSPLVGRNKELQMLEHALDRARTERTSELFTLLGQAGVGKSRLVQEFLARSAPAATVLRGRCLSYGEGITFYPVAEIVHTAAGIAEGDTPALAREKLAALVAETPDAARVAPLVGSLFGWSETAATEDAFWAVRKLFEHLARDRPLVLVFDDIHWAEPTFLDLVEHLADWTREAAVLLLCIARPELLDVRPGWGGGKLNATSILLEPLAAEDASRLVDNLLGSAEMPEAARARILEAAEGNPLFVEEMLGMLIDDGLLRMEEGGSWRAVDDLADLTVPPTIQLLLAARIDRLDAEERAVMERGAVEGKVFHTGAVATLSPDRLRPKVRSRLLALARKELIRPDRAEFAGEDAFRFRHLLIRDAAYRAMPKEQRADLHERFAEWLERVAGERLSEYEEILAHHLEQAYRYRTELGPADERTRVLGDAAGERLLSSAERAMDRSDFTAAQGLLRRATEVSVGPLRARSLLALARSNARATDFPEAVRIAREAETVARASGTHAVELRSRLVVTTSRAQIDPTVTEAQVAEEVETLRRALDALGDRDGVFEATIIAARYAFFEGQAERCREIALRIADRGASRPFHDRRELQINLTVPTYFGPMPATKALEELDRVRAIIGRDSLLSDASAGQLRIALFAMLGRAEDADAETDRVRRLWDEIGDVGTGFQISQPLGEANRYLHRFDRAEAMFRIGAERLNALGETGFNSTMTAKHALALCDLRRFADAQVAIDRSRELSAEDDLATQAAWRMAQARVDADRNDHDVALERADEAVAILDATDYLNWQGEAHEIRGAILLAAGRVPEAQAELATALERYEAKENLQWADRVRARLMTPSG